MAHISPDLSFELTLWAAGALHLAGLDEAGRGAWAGPVSAGAVISPPTPVSANDCLSDPLNAAGCMSTPFIKQGVAAVISLGATLATILVTLLGSAATSAGGAVAGAVAVALVYLFVRASQKKSDPSQPFPMASLTLSAQPQDLDQQLRRSAPCPPHLWIRARSKKPRTE